MGNRKPRIGILLGEATGVGPELIARLVADKSMVECCCPLIVDDVRVYEQGVGFAKVDAPITVVKTVEEIAWNESEVYFLDIGGLDPNDYEMGKLSAVSGKHAGEAIMAMVDLIKKNVIEGICFAPFNKTCLKMGGWKFDSVTNMVGKIFHCKYVCEMSLAGNIWTTRATSHIPLTELKQNLTRERIELSIELADKTLRDAGYESPRIAVLGVNPHTGDSGGCGREEIEIIQPAMEAMKAKGYNVSGLYTADVGFGKAYKGEFDAVVTMYHDQGEPLLKLLDGHLVAVSGGLPFPMATTSHGPVYSRAGKGTADEEAMRRAVKITAKMASYIGACS